MINFFHMNCVKVLFHQLGIFPVCLFEYHCIYSSLCTAQEITVLLFRTKIYDRLIFAKYPILEENRKASCGEILTPPPPQESNMGSFLIYFWVVFFLGMKYIYGGQESRDGLCC